MSRVVMSRQREAALPEQAWCLVQLQVSETALVDAAATTRNALWRLIHVTHT